METDIIIEKIRRLMKEKKITAYRLGKDTGVSHATISRMLSGKTRATKPYGDMLTYLLNK